MKNCVKRIAVVLLAVVMLFCLPVSISAYGDVQHVSDSSDLSEESSVITKFPIGVRKSKASGEYNKVCIEVNSEWVGDYRYIFLDSEIERDEYECSDAGRFYSYYGPIGILADGKNRGYIAAGPSEMYRYTGEDYYKLFNGTFEWIEQDSGTVWDSGIISDWNVRPEPIEDYDITVGDPVVEIRDRTKYMTYDVTYTYTGELPELTDVAVVCDWLAEDPDAASEGVEVTAQLMRDGEAFGEPVVLNKENQWQYMWTGLDGKHEWTVKRTSPTLEGYESVESTVAWCLGTHEEPVAPPSGGNDSYDSYGSMTGGSGTETGGFTEVRGYVVCSIANVAKPVPEKGGWSGVRKVWFGDDPSERPGKLEVDVREHSTKVVSSLTSEMGWKYIWHGIQNWYSSFSEVVPEKYVKREFRNGQLSILVNIRVPDPVGGIILPSTGGEGTRNLALVASVVVLSSGLALLSNGRKKRYGG